MTSIIMYKRQIDPDSSRFKKDSVTKIMRGMEGIGFSCYLRQAINTLYENEIFIHNL